VLRDAVLGYLQRVGRGQLSDVESDEHARLVAATGDIESMSVAISRELAPLARVLKESGITPSDETRALLERLFETIREASQSALTALVDSDERAAQAVVARRDAVWNLASELHRQQAARLAQDDPERLLKHRVQVDILDKLHRVYSVAEHMAISVLPRGVLAAELLT
jgi:Na+/phosphate symporter